VSAFWYVIVVFLVVFSSAVGLHARPDQDLPGRGHPEHSKSQAPDLTKFGGLEADPTLSPEVMNTIVNTIESSSMIERVGQRLTGE